MTFDIDALIAKARENFDTVKPVDQDVLLGDDVVTVRLWPLTGVAWRELVVNHPVRDGVQHDLALGYDLESVVRAYPRVYLVDGDEVTDVAARWAEVCDVLSAPDLKALSFAVWGLNEYDPSQKLAAAGKASKGGLRKKRSSPANSASQSGS